MFATNQKCSHVDCGAPTPHTRSRRILQWRRQAGAIPLLALLAASQLSAGPPHAEIHSIAELLSLTNEEASRQFPVHLRGIVTVNSPARYESFVQEGKLGVYVANSPDDPLQASEGDLVDIIGVSKRGEYAPIVAPRKVVVLGHPGMPAPIPANEADLQNDRYPNAWVEVEGEVTAVRDANFRGQLLDLKIGGQRFQIDADPNDFSSKDVRLGAIVRVRAVLGCYSNYQGERLRPQLYLRSRNDFDVVRPGRTKWPDIPLTDLSRLLRYHGVGHIGDLIHVRGTVTLLGAEDRLHIQDGQTALSADPSAAAGAAVGDCLELIGFLDHRPPFGLWLEGAMGRKCAQPLAIAPFKANEDQIVSPNAGGLLIEMEGTVVQQSNGLRSDILYLVTTETYKLPFVAELFHPSGKAALPRFLSGDRVRVTGVYDVDEVRSGLQGTSRRIILRTKDDVRLTFRAPWWRRAPWFEVASGALSFLSLLFIWNLALRREVRRKTSALEEQSLALIDARDRAEAGARVKSDFLSTMSHEIRTPLNGVIGMTYLLLDTPLSAEQLDFAATIKTSGEALLHLINEILDFSKMESGKLSLEAVDFDLRDVVEQSVAIVMEDARKKDLALDVLVAADVPEVVKGDPARIRQIILNLLSNAIKFTDNGRVGISVHSTMRAADQPPAGSPEAVRRPVACLRFEITDTGIGIKPEAGGDLFQSFTQADASTTRRFGGTGLGLAISKRLVELMGGKIGYESELNLGSAFWFEVPLEINESEEDQPALLERGLKGRRVLLVDDNPVIRQVARQTLEIHGVEVAEASPSGEALEMIERAAPVRPFDAALIGIQLPQMDGLALAGRIRHLHAGESLALLLLTAPLNPVDLAKSEELGISGQVAKPLRRSALLTELSRVLASRPKAAAPADPPPVAPKAPLRVLLAEDNLANQKLARAMLERLGCHVDIVANGVEAIRVSTRSKFDVILMDCQMPEMDGYSATATIRSVEARRGDRTPIIALTASAMQGDRERCMEAGMDDYLTKPLAIETLAGAISRWSRRCEALTNPISGYTVSRDRRNG